MSRENIRDRAIEYVKANNMLNKGEKVVAGISGGADSMCLLDLLIEWSRNQDLDITVLHVNHGIRGKEAVRDEEFVKNYCLKNSVNCRIVHADIVQMAKDRGCTVEEAGRDFRYEEFVKLCTRTGSKRIAVAHNLNDTAETVLFNMIRGSGLKGMTGIAPVRMLKNGISLVRPLLATSRADIEDYLKEKGIEYITDSTNFENDYSRNCIRNMILPVLKNNINTSAEEHIANLAFEVSETEELVSGLTERAFEDVRIDAARIDADKLLSYHPAVVRRVIRKLIGEAAGRLKDIERVHIDAVTELLKKNSGHRIDLPYGITAVKEYGELKLLHALDDKEEEAVTALKEGIRPDLTKIADIIQIKLGQGRLLRLSFEQGKVHEEFPKNLYTKWFDYDKIDNDVSVRTRKSGDYLMVRMNGGTVRKDLGRWFIDNKIPGNKRDRIPLLTAGSHVLWICGYRRDDTCLVDDTTTNILVAELVESQDIPTNKE